MDIKHDVEPADVRVEVVQQVKMLDTAQNAEKGGLELYRAAGDDGPAYGLQVDLQVRKATERPLAEAVRMTPARAVIQVLKIHHLPGGLVEILELVLNDHIIKANLHLLVLWNILDPSSARNWFSLGALNDHTCSCSSLV